MAEVARPPAGKDRSRVIAYVAVALIFAAVVAGAWFQEPIGYFVKLHAWDTTAPGRVVTTFLNAGKAGDRKTADNCLVPDTLRPLEKDGKWVGYSLVSIAGTIDYLFSDLAGSDPKPSRTELIYIGRGASEVYVPDSSGKDVKYRLEMIGGSWRITEILGGRPHR